MITHNTLLTNNIGPCQGNGIVVGASNIHINLNGHTITGSHQGTPSATEQAGVLMDNVTNVTVMNGTVQYFDAGVAINGGSANTIRGIDALNNVIEGNVVVHNGPFSGISLVDSSSHNMVLHNRAANNDVVNLTTTHQGTLCGAGALTAGSGGNSNGPMPSGRPVQDIGIRVEGPGATDNTVQGNDVTQSALYGISIHAYPCNIMHGMNATGNVGNSILHNFVSGTGDATHKLDPTASGIGILRQGPTTRVCVSNGNTIVGNTSVNNWENGIFLGGPDYVQLPKNPAEGTNATNVVAHNVVDNNHVDGIHLDAGALNNALVSNTGHGNGQFDGADFNPTCDHNAWVHNHFGTVNQPCVASGRGSTGTVTTVVLTGISGSSSAMTLSPTFSDAVNVTNAGGFTVYSNATCTALVGTGQSVTSGNGTMTPVIQLNAAPAAGAPAYYEVAANSVTTSNGVTNAAVGCSSIRFGT